MKKPYLIVIAVLAVFGVATYVVGYSGGNPRAVVEGDLIMNGDYMEAPDGANLGAIPSPDVYERMTFHRGFNTGGEYFATTSAIATYTIPPSELDGDAYWIEWTPNLDTTLTLPATTTVGFDNIVGRTAGDTRVVYLQNASSTAAASITLAAGTGIDLQDNEDSADLAVVGLDIMKMTFIRKGNSDVAVLLEELTEAD